MTYKFKYKRNFFYKTLKNAIGHNYDVNSDRMDVYFDDKIISLPKWSECTLILGQDFILKQKKDIEKESR